MEYIYNIITNTYLIGLFALLVAFVISVKMYDVIIYLAYKKNLMAEPEVRSAHNKKIPNLGGVGIFIAFTLCIAVIGSLIELVEIELRQLLILLAAITILFFLGVKDDLIGLSPNKKFVGQIVAATLVVLITNVRIEGLEGFLGIYELPYLISVGLSVFTFVFLTNAYNLIDGIDGLAGSVAILASFFFGLFFLLNGYTLMVMVSFISMGSLAGFLKYNLSDNRKLFMGDSGSLFIGFLLIYQAIFFLGITPADGSIFMLPNKLMLVLAVLSLPILDTLRVFIIRISENRSPFVADRNHMHHCLLDAGLSHKKSTLLIVILNVIIILMVFLIGDLNIHLQLLIFATAVPVIILLPYFIIREKGFVKWIISKFLSRAITNS